MSNTWNSTLDEIDSHEVECARCHGTGQDRDGCDCMFCDGFGTMLV